MLKVFKKWMDHYFSDEEAVGLMLILISCLLLVIYAGDIIAPVIASVIIAYLLQGLLQKFLRWFSYAAAARITFTIFIGCFVMVLFFVLPIIGKQLTALTSELPIIAVKLKDFLMGLQGKYPDTLTQDQVATLIGLATEKVGSMGQFALSLSLASIPNVLALMIYLVLIPILVYFFLKDTGIILSWFGQFLPEERPLMYVIWHEMNRQIANYARGKAIEILIVGSATFITFAIMGQKYAALLGLLVGLSVIIPYIGATVVTIPVAVIAYFQWGMTDTFGYVMLAYGIIQFLDGNVIVPLLFSEAVSMHPVAIIVAVLFFGGLWGMWGVFFAIPLATLIKALLEAWPRGIKAVEN